MDLILLSLAALEIASPSVPPGGLLVAGFLPFTCEAEVKVIIEPSRFFCFLAVIPAPCLRLLPFDLVFVTNPSTLSHATKGRAAETSPAAPLLVPYSPTDGVDIRGFYSFCTASLPLKVRATSFSPCRRPVFFPRRSMEAVSGHREIDFSPASLRTYRTLRHAFSFPSSVLEKKFFTPCARDFSSA